MTGILGQLKWESLKKRRKDNRLILLYKGLKGKAVYQQMTLSPKLGVVGISTLWHFRLPLPIQMFIKVASSPRLSGIGMPSPILWSHPLKMQRIVLLSSLLWWELGTNSLITGPGEWLSFRRFTSKLSWSWSWRQIVQTNQTVSDSGPPHQPPIHIRVAGGMDTRPTWLLQERSWSVCTVQSLEDYSIFWSNVIYRDFMGAAILVSTATNKFSRIKRK